MPNKYPVRQGWNVPKQKFKVTNWSEYNESLRRRGNIIVWLSDDAISQWYETDRVYNGTGAPRLYTDFAIVTCHEIRLVYKLPLRQCQGLIDSLFQLMDIHSMVKYSSFFRQITFCECAVSNGACRM